MLLNELEQKQLDDLFSNNIEIANLINNAQVCLLVKNVSTKHIVDKVAAEIKSIIRKQRTRYSSNIVNNLRSIVEQLINGLKCQEEEFVNQLCLIIIGIYKNKIGSQINIANLLIELIKDSSAKLHFKLPGKVIVNINEKSIDSLSKIIDEVNGHSFGYLLYRRAGMFGMLVCLCLAYVEIREKGFELTDFQIRNTFMFLFALAMYQYFSVKLVQLTFNQVEQDFGAKNLPVYSLEKIAIVDFTENKVINHTYIPQIDTLVDNKIPSQVADNTMQASKPQMPVIKREKGKSGKDEEKPIAIARPLKQPVTWPADSVLFGNNNMAITENDVYEMRGNFPRNIRYFSFFNRQALKAQGVNENGQMWKNYFARVEHGQVVGPEGETGIKTLKPPILTDIKIGNQKFGYRLFRWSDKKIGTLERLLSNICATQLDASGTQYRLVDHCWHCPVGPGH